MAFNSLMFSSITLSLINPLILWDVGFQLSFMATLGMIVGGLATLTGPDC